MGKRTKDNKDSKEAKGKALKQSIIKPEVKAPEEALLDHSDESQLTKIFGFCDFDSTKNSSHVESDVFGVFKGSKVKSKFRQYMNRKGGFNKVLDKSN